MTSPLRPFCRSISTSLLKLKSFNTTKPSTSTLQKPSKKNQDESDSDISYTPSLTHGESSPSTVSLEIKSTSKCSELIGEEKNKKHQTLHTFLH